MDRDPVPPWDRPRGSHPDGAAGAPAWRVPTFLPRSPEPPGAPHGWRSPEQRGLLTDVDVFGSRRGTAPRARCLLVTAHTRGVREMEAENVTREPHTRQHRQTLKRVPRAAEAAWRTGESGSPRAVGRADVCFISLGERSLQIRQFSSKNLFDRVPRRRMPSAHFQHTEGLNKYLLHKA